MLLRALRGSVALAGRDSGITSSRNGVCEFCGAALTVAARPRRRTAWPAASPQRAGASRYYTQALQQDEASSSLSTRRPAGQQRQQEPTVDFFSSHAPARRSKSASISRDRPPDTAKRRAGEAAYIDQLKRLPYSLSTNEQRTKKIVLATTLLDERTAAANIDRVLFDKLFSIVCEPDVHRQNAWSALRVLERIARKWCRFELLPEQVRAIFETGTKVSDLERDAHGQSTEWDEARFKYLDDFYYKVKALPRRTRHDKARDLVWLQRHITRKLAKGQLTKDEALAEIEQVERLCTKGVQAWPMQESTSTYFDRSGTLAYMFELDASLALSHLDTMLALDIMPSVDALRHVLQNHQPALFDDAMYDRARAVLDQACSGTDRSTQGLEDLMQARLQAVDQAERFQARPVESFIRWLAESTESKEVADRLATVKIALRLCHVYLRSRKEQYKPGGSTRFDSFQAALDLLASPDLLVPERPELVKQRLSLLEYAATIAFEQLPSRWLVYAVRTILSALALDVSSSFPIARHLYSRMRAQAPPGSDAPFAWTGHQLPVFSLLLRESLSDRNHRDPAFALNLYFDLAADGLTLPERDWPVVIEAAAARGAAEDTVRVLEDYETVRPIESRLVDRAMRVPIERYDTSKTLALLEIFRSRPRSAASGPAVSETSYESVLNILARAKADMRIEAVRVFGYLVEDHAVTDETGTIISSSSSTRVGVKPCPSVRAWNALLLSHVQKAGTFTTSDVDRAGSVYDAMLAAKCEPDRDTYSYLAQGFLRLVGHRRAQRDTLARYTARFSSQRLSAETQARREKERQEEEDDNLSSAIRTCEAAFDRSMLVRASQMSTLLLYLGERNEFERAKEINERWWTVAVEYEARTVRGVSKEMEIVRQAMNRLLSAERKAASRLD